MPFVDVRVLCSASPRRRPPTLLPLLDAVELAARAREAGLSISVHDGTFSSFSDLVAAIDASPRPRAVVIHVSPGSDASAWDLARRAKENDLAVLSFGAAAWGNSSAHLDAGADAVAATPATAVELLLRWGADAGAARKQAAEQIDGLAGVAVMDLDGVVHSTPAAEDRQAAPVPVEDGVDIARHLSFGVVRGHRSILPVRATERPESRARWRASAKAAGARILEQWRRFEPDQLRFADEDLARDRRYLLQLCATLAQARPAPSWTARACAHHLDQLLLGRMKSAGCRELVVAFEARSSAPPGAARLADAERVLTAAARLGLDARLDVGVAPSGQGDLKDGLRWLREVAPGGASPSGARVAGVELRWLGTGRTTKLDRALLRRLGEAALAGRDRSRGLWLGLWRLLGHRPVREVTALEGGAAGPGPALGARPDPALGPTGAVRNLVSGSGPR